MSTCATILMAMRPTAASYDEAEAPRPTPDPSLAPPPPAAHPHPRSRPSPRAASVAPSRAIAQTHLSGPFSGPFSGRSPMRSIASLLTLFLVLTALGGPAPA